MSLKDDLGGGRESEEESINVVVLTTEAGVEIVFCLLADCEYDDAHYIVCAPFEQIRGEDSDEEDLELYAFRYTKDDEGLLDLEPVDDDDIFDALIRALQLAGILPGPDELPIDN